MAFVQMVQRMPEIRCPQTWAAARSFRLNLKPIPRLKQFSNSSTLMRNNKISQNNQTPHVFQPIPRHPLLQRPTTAYVVVSVIIASCCSVTGYYWHLNREARKGSKEARAALVSFPRYMVMSTQNLREGRWWTIVTATFTHVEFWHLGVNMMTLWGLGTFFAKSQGVPQFVIVWVGSALMGGVAELYGHRGEFGNRQGVGASGSLFGLSAALACLYPRMRVTMVVFPMTMGLAVLGSAVFSAAAIQNGWIPWMGHADHLGGMAFGALWWLLVLRRRQLRW